MASVRGSRSCYRGLPDKPCPCLPQLHQQMRVSTRTLTGKSRTPPAARSRSALFNAGLVRRRENVGTFMVPFVSSTGHGCPRSSW